MDLKNIKTSLLKLGLFMIIFLAWAGLFKLVQSVWYSPIWLVGSLLTILAIIFYTFGAVLLTVIILMIIFDLEER